MTEHFLAYITGLVLISYRDIKWLQVLRLRDQLSDAEKEVKKLSERRNGSPEGERSCSPSSSFSMDTPFLGEFGEDLFYVHENIYINNGMEWVNYYDI